MYDDQEIKLGLLINRLAKYSLLTIEGPLHFESKKDLFDKVGEIVFKKRMQMEEEVSELNGWPVEDDQIFNVTEDEKFNTYTKTEKSKVKFTAGYWGINSTGQYVLSYCPKLDTLLNNEHIGPFVSKFIAMQEISVANKRLNDEKQNNS